MPVKVGRLDERLPRRLLMNHRRHPRFLWLVLFVPRVIDLADLSVYR